MNDKAKNIWILIKSVLRVLLYCVLLFGSYTASADGVILGFVVFAYVNVITGINQLKHFTYLRTAVNLTAISELSCCKEDKVKKIEEELEDIKEEYDKNSFLLISFQVCNVIIAIMAIIKILSSL